MLSPHHISACSALGVLNPSPYDSLWLESPRLYVIVAAQKPSFTGKPITTKTRPLHSLRLSNTLDPESLMKDLESELFHYTTGRFLRVSFTLSRLCPTPKVTCSVRMRNVASKSVASSSIFPVSSKSLLRHKAARLTRSSAVASSERAVSTVPLSSLNGTASSWSHEFRIPFSFPRRRLTLVKLLLWTSF